MMKTVLHVQNLPQGGHTPTSDYKQSMEAHVTTIYMIGGTLTYEPALLEDILAAPATGSISLQAYVGMNAVARHPYDILYMDLIVIIIMAKNCAYNSLRKWLAQNQMIPGAQAYTT